MDGATKGRFKSSVVLGLSVGASCSGASHECGSFKPVTAAEVLPSSLSDALARLRVKQLKCTTCMSQCRSPAVHRRRPAPPSEARPWRAGSENAMAAGAKGGRVRAVLER
eukprot:7087619-Lingulodinium_polyedra.AAC.1